jgi:hypothetical protein
MRRTTLINADDALKAVFGGKKQVTMFRDDKTRLWACEISNFDSWSAQKPSAPARGRCTGDFFRSNRVVALRELRSGSQRISSLRFDHLTMIERSNGAAKILSTNRR